MTLPGAPPRHRWGGGVPGQPRLIRRLISAVMVIAQSSNDARALRAAAGHGSASAQRLRTCAVRGGLRGTWVGKSVTNRKGSRLNAGPLLAATARTSRAGPRQA